jgi:hypothetical protein
MKMTSHWEEFYATHPSPAEFDENKKRISDFCQNVGAERKIVLVTVIELCD